MAAELFCLFFFSPVGPTFDLKTKNCYVLSNGGNSFSQFGLFHTVQKRHFFPSGVPILLCREILGAKSRFSLGVPSSAFTLYLVCNRRSLLTGKSILSTIYAFINFLLAFF